MSPGCQEAPQCSVSSITRCSEDLRGNFGACSSLGLCGFPLCQLSCQAPGQVGEPRGKGVEICTILRKHKAPFIVQKQGASEAGLQGCAEPTHPPAVPLLGRGWGGGDTIIAASAHRELHFLA